MVSFVVKGDHVESKLEGSHSLANDGGCTDAYIRHGPEVFGSIGRQATVNLMYIL